MRGGEGSAVAQVFGGRVEVILFFDLCFFRSFFAFMCILDCCVCVCVLFFKHYSFFSLFFLMGIKASL